MYCCIQGKTYKISKANGLNYISSNFILLNVSIDVCDVI